MKRTTAQDTHQHLADLIKDWLRVPSNQNRKVPAHVLHAELSGAHRYFFDSAKALGRAINQITPAMGLEYFKLKRDGQAIYIFYPAAESVTS